MTVEEPSAALVEHFDALGEALKHVGVREREGEVPVVVGLVVELLERVPQPPLGVLPGRPARHERQERGERHAAPGVIPQQWIATP